MKTFFIHAKSNASILLPDKEIDTLPRKIALVTNIQHLHKLGELKKQLAEKGKEVYLAGQILGCRAESAAKFEDKADAFLYVGSGEFHPLKVAMQTNKPVYCWNPASEKIGKISEQKKAEYLDYKQRQLNLFLNAQKVGILISAKTGQSDNKINSPSIELKMKKALQLKTRKDKEYYLFAFDTLSIQELENFTFIDCWVNTACSRIADEKINIVNIDDIFSSSGT
ncbi:MAG: diphthamide synthesis protein [Candidatus Aenigmarchaeota archaeon]|nr:diphthamide synthesis protein [Candidatus Aenigmarchaeota archaeon]